MFALSIINILFIKLHSQDDLIIIEKIQPRIGPLSPLSIFSVLEENSHSRSSYGFAKNASASSEMNEATQLLLRNRKLSNGTKTDPNDLALLRYLNFTSRTALNFMHFHRTGGWSYKTLLISFFRRKRKHNGSIVRTIDTCYKQKKHQRWRCDWDHVRRIAQRERTLVDVLHGHQYWVGGAIIMLPGRDVRTFSVLRNPFSRKLSFFYHFFVHELGRRTRDVSFDEVRAFLVNNSIRKYGRHLGREVGPNYIAGRLLSDGSMGYVGNSYHRYYQVLPGEERTVIARSMRVLRDYIFLGLQIEPAATTCMLRKTVDLFSIVQGISTHDTLQKATMAPVLNRGSYPFKAREVWRKLSKKEREQFKSNEQIDLDIYKQVVFIFLKQVRHFGCEAFVKNKRLGMSTEDGM